MALTTGVTKMNKDQIKGVIKNAEGKVQEQVGKLVGNPGQQVKGISKQVVGKAQENLGDAKEFVKNSSKKP
jgi:uncharacterized protein YjbJ (UPF0337 family)